VIVGTASADDAAVLDAAYAPLAARGVPVLHLSTRSAELCKYAANTMLATRISFMNEMADIAEATGADIEEVREGVGRDLRIGPAFLRAGIGYGGSCFPKDVGSLRHAARTCGLTPRLLDAGAATNDCHLRWPLRQLSAAVGGDDGLKGLRIAVWGVAFKPGTDDIRDAASGIVMRGLLDNGANVQAYDPVAMPKAIAVYAGEPGVRWCASAAEALEGAYALLLLTEWPEFIGFPPGRAAAAMAGRQVFDGRNVLPGGAWASAGFELHQVGRPMAPARREVALAATPEAG
jgi:UDPglucose 6-dehydrogenase